MNLLSACSTHPLVKRLPVCNARSTVVRRILFANTALYGLYLLATGPYKLAYERQFTAGPASNIESLGFFHFAHTSLPQFLFTSATLYTLGHYHAAAYGAGSFLTLFGASAFAGSALTAVGLRTGSTTQTQAGAMAPAAGLIAYHVFRNPGWFKFVFRPIPLLALVTLYGAYTGDRAAIGGVGAGYLAFLFGL